VRKLHYSLITQQWAAGNYEF